MDRVVRSTRVPVALRLPAPQIRSPSQWPGTARSATSAGRSPVMAMGSRDLGVSGLAVAAVPAGGAPPSHGMFGLESRLSLALHVDGLVDGLVVCVHASVIRVAASEPAADLFGAPVLVESGLDLVPQSCAGHDLAWLGAFEAVGGLGGVHAAAHQARCFARLAACMSRSFSYLVPSNSYTMFRFLPNPRCRDVH